MNLFWFYNHFNSITLKDPLNLAFVEINNDLIKLDKSVFERDKNTLQYQLFCIASTLNSGRNGDSSKLEQLFDVDKILTNPLFVLLFDNAFKILESSNEVKLKEHYKVKNKVNKYKSSIRFYLDTPSEELRHTNFESLSPIKKVELFTEGKTDASIISHAFIVLTDDKEPYWSVTNIDNVTKKDGGGANELAKHLEQLSINITSPSDKEKTIIGIFDNDEKGNQEFNGLKDHFELINGIIKKDKNHNIYAILLPIPEDAAYLPYHQDKQTFKFFSIEHYFNLEFLINNNMVKQTSIHGVFEITGNKNDFSRKIQQNSDVLEFVNFQVLFREIDNICKNEINYFDE